MAATARLHVEAALAEGAEIPLPEDQAHYLRHVLRQQVGASLLLFNGRDGEWRAEIAHFGKRDGILRVHEQTRQQQNGPDLWLLFAPIRQGRLETIVEKATELGASRIVPVLTQRCQVRQVNAGRLLANAREAAEQCERLTVPEVREPLALDKALAGWDAARPLIFLDESGGGAPLVQVLADLPAGPLAVLVGPEGGFAPEERALLARLPFARPVGLGPRILRAETAAIAALAVVQAVRGDWNRAPRQ